MDRPSKPQLIASIERELELRRRCYPRWVAEGRMSQEKADHEIACMQVALDLVCGQVLLELRVPSGE